MKNLKVPLILLFLFLFIVFNIEKLSFGANTVLEFHGFVDVLITVMIIVPLMFRVFRKLPSYANLAFWVISYFGLWFFANKNMLPQINLQVTLIEVVFVSVAAVLSRDVAINLYEVENTLDKLFFASFRGRTMSLDEASEEIKNELLRSRRYQRSLTVLVIEPDSDSISQSLMPTTEEINHNLAKLYVMGKVSKVINVIARRPDLIIKLDQPERFILVCPETSVSSSNMLIQRIRSTVEADLGITISCGVASFPEDALTFEDLLQKANAKLEKSNGFSLSKTEKGEGAIKRP
jgi:GGDEF domain-containing protein